MDEFVCKNCGKRNRFISLDCKTDPVFCNKQCQQEWWKKNRDAAKKEAAEKKRQHYTLTKTKTPESQCRRCKYGTQIGDRYGCRYFEVKGHTTRHFLHPEGLPDECQEFKPKRKRRKPTGIVI